MTDTTTVQVSPVDATFVTVHVDNTIVAEPGPDRTTVILTAPLGPRGPKGDDGELGPTGLSAYEVALLEGFIGSEAAWLASLVGPQGASGGFYTHTQGFPASVWTITHNLGYRPQVQVFDSLDREVLGDVLHIDVNTLTVTFTAGFSGKSYLS